MMSRTTNAWLWVLAFASASLGAGSLLAAPLSTFTPVDTRIDNRGEVLAENEFAVVATVDSNLSSVFVGGINSLDLEDDRSVTANPGDSVTFAHRLTNTGNQDDSYTLSVAQDAGDDGDFTSISVYLDANGNGDFDLGEPLLVSTATLEQDEFVDLIVIVGIDGSEEVGDLLSYTLTATSVNDGVSSDSNIDDVLVIGDPNINLFKTSTRQCTADVLTQIDGDYEYSINFDNQGILSLSERSVSVDAVATDGVLIEDQLDSRIELLTGQTITANPASAKFLVQRTTDSVADLWISYGNWNGTDELAAVGLIFDAADLDVGDSGSVSFGVAIAADVVVADQGDIFNTASIDLDGDSSSEFISNQVCNELDVLEPNLDLADDRTDEALPGATLFFDHVLTNTGELDDSYSITAVDVAATDDGDFDVIALFYVADGDGQFDDVLTTTPTLSPTDSLNIRVEVLVPAAAALGDSYQLTIRAQSVLDGTLTDVNTDTLNIIQPALLDIVKTSTRQCTVDVLTQLDGDYQYGISVTNSGDLAPAERSISVDAVSVTKLLLEDVLDSRIELLSGQTIVPAPVGAQFVVQRSADIVGDLWIDYSNWNGTDQINAVGLLVDADDLQEGESASVNLGVAVRADVVPADQGNILNSAFVDLDGNNTAEFTSNQVCNELDVLEPNLDLADDRSASALAGSTVFFDHVLTNSGELDDSYSISIAQVAGTDDGNFDSVAVFYVADGDGLFNDPLTTTATLAPSDSLAIRIQAVVPAAATVSDSYQLTIEAVSNLDGSLNDLNTDTLTVLDDVILNIVKSNIRQCTVDVLTQIDGDYSYSLSVINDGDTAPDERAFTLNASTVNGVMIEDQLDSRIELLAGQTLTPTAGQVVVQRSLDVSSDFWISYASWNGTDALAAIAIFIDADDLEAGEGTAISFNVRVEADVTASDQGNIFNRALVDLDGDSIADFSSNQVCNELDVLEPNLDLQADQSANVIVGQTIEFIHTLENTGELDDSYAVVVQNATGDNGNLTGLAVFYDADADSFLDDPLTSTPTLMPGDILQIRIEGTVPTGVSAGDLINLNLVATSNLDATLSDTNIDSLTLIDSAIIELTKSNSTSCAVTLNQGDSYDYRIDFINSGDLPPAERSHSIDGAATDGVLIQDELAIQLLLATAQTIAPTPSAAQFVVQRTLDVGANLWIGYSSWNGTDALSSVGLLVDADDLEPGESGSLGFSVQIDPAVAPANQGLINNQAYVDLDGDDTDNFESNIVCNTLDVLEPNLDLSADQNIISAAGLEVQFDHLVENTGELTDSYTLTLVNLAGDDEDLTDLKLYHDLNNNDQFDSGEPEVSSTGSLDPGDEFPLVIVGLIPSGASIADIIQIEVKAVSTLAATLQDINTDTITVTADAVIELNKLTTNACPIELEAGDTYSYTVNFSNTGMLAPIERNVIIDGIGRDGVLIEDALPVGASLVAASTPTFAPAASRLIVQTAAQAAASVGSATDFWTSYAAWNGTDVIEAIGLFVGSADLEPGESGTLSWLMEIDAGALAGAQIFNTAIVDLDNDDIADFSSNTVCNLVGTANPAVDLRVDQAVQAVAGATVEFIHDLENTGDSSDTFAVTLQNLAGDDGDLSGLSLFYDSDSDGDLDDPLTITPVMGAGDVLQIRIEGVILGGPTVGDEILIQVTAVSQTDTGVSDSNTDTITVIENALIDLDKSSSRACTVDTLTQLDGEFDYSISWENEGSLPPIERPLSVSALPTSGVLIEDYFDSRLQVRTGQTILPSPVSATVVVHVTGAAADVWVTYSDWDAAGGVDDLDAFGILVPAADMDAGDIGSVTLGVSVRSDLLPADEGNILNVASIDLDGVGANEFTSEQVCNELDYIDPELDLRDDRTATALAGDFVEFLHELENTGVQSDSYDISLANLTGDNGDLSGLTAFYDADSDGDLDDPLTSTPVLAPGEVLAIRVLGQLLGSLSVDDQIQVSIQARSNLVNSVTDTNTDTVRVIEDLFIDLVKSSTRSCSIDTLTQADGQFEYSISFENQGDIAPDQRSIIVDGLSTDGVLIADFIDSRLNLLGGQTITALPAGADFLVHETAAASDVWRSYTDWNAAGGTDAIDAVGLLVAASDLEADETGSFSFAVAVRSSISATDAGSILNTAMVDIDGNGSAEYTSNQVCNELSVAIAVDVEQSQSVIAGAGDSLEFLHTIENIGDVVDAYSVSVANIGADDGDFVSLSVFYDSDSDGDLDDLLTTTPNMAPGEILDVRVLATLSASQGGSTDVILELLAQSTLDVTVEDSNQDRVTVSALPNFSITKTSDASCAVALNPGDSIAYSVSFANSGGTPEPISYLISGATVEGIILEDHLPYGIQPTGTIAGNGRAILRPYGQNWIDAADWNGTSAIRSVGIFYTAAELDADPNGSLSFSAAINSTATNQSTLVNTASITTGGDETQTFNSNSTCALVESLVEADIRFMRPTDPIGITLGNSVPVLSNDTDFEDSEIYRIDNGISSYSSVRDGVYIQVDSSTISDATYTELEDGRRQVVVSITANGTLASTQMILQETFPGSGIYRAIRPLVLSLIGGEAGICGADNPVEDYSAAVAPECVLKTLQGDTLTVSLFDDGVGEILDDAAIVDPLGVVFDSVTKQPVAGAAVYVCAAGATAPDDGIDDDPCGADAELAIDPFRFIEDGINVPLDIQITGDDGFYQYAFLLEGDYFMGVDAPSGYAFASGKDPIEFVTLIVEDVFDGVTVSRLSQVFDASYGRNGYLSAVADSGVFHLDELNPLVVVDLPIDPVELALDVSSSLSCDNLVAATDPLTYSISYANVGNLTPTESIISVDGASDSGILFVNPMPFDVLLNPVQTAATVLTGAQPLVQLFPDLGTDSWISLAAWDGVSPVASLAVLVPGSEFGPGAVGGYQFDVNVSASLTDQTLIENRLGVDVDGDGEFDFVSATICNTAQGPSAEIRFTSPNYNLMRNGTAPVFENDDDFIDTGLYRLEDNLLNYDPTRDGIYIELRSTSIPRSGFNVLNDGRRQIVVTLESSLTGDDLIVVLHETGFASGLYRSTRSILLSGTQSGNGGQCPSAEITAPDYASDPPAECVLQSETNDLLTVTFLDPGLGITLEDDALVDPLGLVFDSQTLAPVEGAEVQIYNADGTVATDPLTGEDIAFQTTGTDGFYQYPFLFPGTFYMNVIPAAGYSFPSAVAPGVLNGQLLQTSSGATTALTVFDASYGQNGFSGVAGSGEYSLDLSNPLIVIDFPLDPSENPVLIVEKSATTDYVELGGLIEYQITVRNAGLAVLSDVQLVDDLPFGFKYINNSMYRDAELSDDPSGAPGPQLRLNVGTMQVGESVQYSYVLQATAGAVDGDGINEAQASATFVASRVLSNVARFQVDVERNGVLSDKAVVFGKVYVDSDCNNIQSEGEWPIGGVKLYMENGTYVITDENGMYTLFGVRAGNHVLKIDPLTLPVGLQLKPIDNRHGADPDSRFVDVLEGEYHRADFAAACPSTENTAVIMDQLIERNESISGDWLLEDASRFNPTLDNNSRSDLAIASSNGGDLSSGIVGNRLNQDDTRNLLTRMSVSTEQLDDQATEEPLEVIPDDFPVAEEAVKTVTAAQAKEGTWLWPKDNISRLGRFVVVVRDGVEPTLFLNDRPVSNSQIGEQFINKREHAQVIAWYGLRLDDGVNSLSVRTKDMFGNERILAEKEFSRPGGAQSMELVLDRDTLPADGGRSRAAMDIRLLDNLGLPARGIYYATIEVSDGFWEEPDLQDKLEGYQVRIENGEARLHLRSSESTGESRIRVTTGLFEQETQITFIQSQRAIFATGILDAGTEFCHKSGSGDPAEDFCDSSQVDTRAAFFLKGQVKGDYFLTLSYDSEKLGDEELLRDLNPNEFYPIMGDSSVRGYEAQSRSKLYMKLEQDRNSIAWGDFVTDVNTNHRSLARVQRTLSGAQAIYNQGKVSAEVFAALVADSRGSVEFAGNGTAMLYRIEQAPIVRNSEVVELIVRDRNASGLVMESVTLERFIDYSIDHLSGDIRFVDSIPTFDQDLNPVFVRVSYDLEGSGDEKLVAGVRGSLELSEDLVIAGSYTTDEHATDGYEVVGSYIEYGPTDRATIIVSSANMDHNDSSKSDGYALYSSIEMEWAEGSRSSATWGRAEAGFQNSGPVSADRQELKLYHSEELGERLTLDAEVLSSETVSSGDTNDSVRVSADYDVAGWTLSLGGRRVEQQSAVTDEFEGSQDTATTIIAGAGRSFQVLGQSMKVDGEYEREAGGQNRERWLLNTSTSLTDKVSLYGTFEKINSLSGINGLDAGTDRLNASFGFETDWLPSTSVYNEYRMRGVTDGRDLEAATGVRGDYTIIDGVQISPRIEIINTLEGNQDADSMAISLGIEESLNENRRSSLRLETRQSDQQDYYGMDISYVSRLNLDWSAFVREDFRYTDTAGSSSEDMSHILTLGLTHRPRQTNDYHMISMYQWKEERGESLLADRSAHLLSVHQNYQVNEDVTVSSRVGAKYEVTPLPNMSFSSLTAVMDGRIIWDLNRRFDLDLHGGVIGTNGFEETRYSAGIGLNYLVNKNLRIGIGYNLIGFDEGDLDPEGYNRHGIYLNAQYKFDEDLFFWLQNDSNKSSRQSDQGSSREKTP